MSKYRLFEPFEFPNILPEIDLTHEEIENHVAKIIYEQDGFKDNRAEAEYPIEIVPVFYRFILREQRIPVQKEFLEEARREMMINGFDLDGQEKDYNHGLIARLNSRTYPSLIRDVHFSKLLTATISEQYKVVYNPALDMAGIDILLIPNDKGGTKYGICLYIDTDYGRNGLKRKRRYRKQFYNVKYIEFPKSIPKGVDKDKIWLYEPSDVDRLIQKIRYAL